MKHSISLEHTILNPRAELREQYRVLGSVIIQICVANLVKAVLGDIHTKGYYLGELACAYINNTLNFNDILELGIILNEEMDYMNGQVSVEKYSRYVFM